MSVVFELDLAIDLDSDIAIKLKFNYDLAMQQKLWLDLHLDFKIFDWIGLTFILIWTRLDNFGLNPGCNQDALWVSFITPWQILNLENILKKITF